jgi:menaquinone-dependent protoporphyrinogen IX oxidase
MKKTLVVYFSKYGSTRKYAEWIAEELDGDIFSLNNIQQIDLSQYGTIILGCSLYPETNKSIKKFVNNFVKLKDKKIVLYTCGAANVNKPENTKNIKKRFENIIPKNTFENINIFYLRGTMDYSLMSIKHRIMMSFMKKMVKNKKEHDEDDKLILESYGKKIDFIDKNTIKEIIEYCKNN